MRHQLRFSVLFLSGLVLALGVVPGNASRALAAERPVAVSPGSASKVALIGDGCPTFSWGAAEGAKSYELVVYRLAEEGEEAQPVLSQRISGSALGWTPALDQCLERGGQYAWSVRAVGGRKGSTEWSSPNLFEVSAGQSAAEFKEALAVVRQYLAEETAGSVGESASNRAQRTGSSPLAPQVSNAPASLAAVGGDSDLQVNGSAVVTVETFSFALCGARGLRYLDQGDGTVLDCNTGLVWLKGASCLGQGTWGLSSTAGTVQNKVEDLNDTMVGSDFGCTDYLEGTYTDWRMPTDLEFCSAGTLAFCPSGSASDSLIDISLGAPFVQNAAGTGLWTEGDAFVGVQSLPHWSATESGANARFVNLNTGLVNTQDKSFEYYAWPVRGGQ